MRLRVRRFYVKIIIIRRIIKVKVGIRLSETVCGLVLAAGLSSRMKAFKPLLPFRDSTVIEASVGSLLSGGAQCVVVVTGHRADEIEDLLSRRFGGRVRFVRNPDPAGTDMLASVRLGCAALPACDAFFLLPGDMPLVERGTFFRLLAARDGAKCVIFPTFEGRRGHPPLIDARLVPDILAYRGGDGLRGLWRLHAELVRLLAVEDAGVRIDLDTPEEYEKHT